MDLDEFNWKDGWQFKRMGDGSVRIRQAAQGEATRPATPEGWDAEAVIPAQEWESITKHLDASPGAPKVPT